VAFEELEVDEEELLLLDPLLPDELVLDDRASEPEANRPSIVSRMRRSLLEAFIVSVGLSGLASFAGCSARFGMS